MANLGEANAGRTAQRAESLLSLCIDSKRSGDLSYAAQRFQQAAEIFAAAAKQLLEARSDFDEENMRKARVLRVILLQSQAASLAKLERFAEAVEICDTALEADDEAAKARMRRALCLLGCGRVKEAVQDLLVLQRASGERVEALRLLRDIREVHPDVVEEAMEEERAETAARGRFKKVVLESFVWVHSTALGLWWWLCFTMVLAALGGAPGALRGGAAARMIHSKASEVVSVIVLLGPIDAMNVGLFSSALSRGTTVSWKMILLNRSLTTAIWLGILEQAKASSLDDKMVLAVASWAIGGATLHVVQIADVATRVPTWLRKRVDIFILSFECLAHIPAFMVVLEARVDYARPSAIQITAGWREIISRVLLYMYPAMAMLSSFIGIRSYMMQCDERNAKRTVKGKKR